MRTIAARSAVRTWRRDLAVMTHYSRSKLALAIAAALSGAVGMHDAPAWATETSSDSTLEEVIVTARKRTENLQDVPISINVYTAKDLQNLSISQFEHYASL